MKAKISNLGDVIIVNLSGRINMEYSQLFREVCLYDIARRTDKIIFNLKNLSFVGSNGIMPFVQTLRDLADQNEKKIRLCQVGSEFQKIFAASALADFQIFSDQDHALASIRGLDFIETNPA